MSSDVLRMVQTLGLSFMSGDALPLDTDYQKRSALLIGVLLALVGEEADRTVERLVEENRALREIFTHALPHVSDAALRERLEKAAGEKDRGLRVQVLTGGNDELRFLLIDLHAHVEELAGEAARGLEEEIWRELTRSTERRRLSASPL